MAKRRKKVEPLFSRQKIGYCQRQFGNKIIEHFSGQTRYQDVISPWYAENKEYFRNCCRTDSEREEEYTKKLNEVRGSNLIGIHIRHGDYATHGLFMAPPQFFLGWIKTVWTKESVLFVATDGKPEVLEAFSEYNPITSRDIGLVWEEAQGFPDLWVLSQCDMLGISQSTFSFLACLLNTRCKKFFRVGQNEGLEEFDPWTSAPFVHLTCYWDKKHNGKYGKYPPRDR